MKTVKIDTQALLFGLMNEEIEIDMMDKNKNIISRMRTKIINIQIDPYKENLSVYVETEIGFISITQNEENESYQDTEYGTYYIETETGIISIFK